MNKAQMTALFLAGAVAGVGGTKLVASTSPLQIYVHALDLRLEAEDDGGYRVSRRAYGTVRRPDGGVKDVGQAHACPEAPGDQTALKAVMQAAADECDWDL